jgi:hypothetical protein
MENWNDGMMGYWDIGILEYWNIGKPIVLPIIPLF